MTKMTSDEKGKEEKTTKKTNSRDRASLLSKLCFFWTWPLFWKGKSEDLLIDDLCLPSDVNLSKTLGDKLQREWLKQCKNQKVNGKKPSLLKALIKVFGTSYILDGILIFIQSIICRPFQPVMLARLLDYFVADSSMTENDAYLYGGGLILLTLGTVFIQHHVVLRTQLLGMRVRVACCSLIYRKMLKLNGNSLAHTTAGQLVNLISNDVSRFDQGLMWLHHVWVMPFMVLLVCYFLYEYVGVAALIGIAVVIVQTVPVNSYISKLTAKLRLKIAERTDERVRIMNEIISGIQVIKMYAWEQPFEKVVSGVREYELKAIRKASFLRGVYMGFIIIVERTTLFASLVAYSLFGNAVTSSIVFSLAQFYNIIQMSVAVMYPIALNLAAESLVSVRRIQDFLTMEELPVRMELMNSKSEDFSPLSIIGKQMGITNLGYEHENDNTGLAVNISNVTAGWTEDSTTLFDINIQVPKGELCAIVGAVGAGKSSIIQLVLRELLPKNGSVKISGRVSYCSQEPWLFVATVRQNILFGLPFDVKRYNEVVRACALEADFDQFPRGDQTLVGERGVSLSGGQRARINLARAVYRQADIYLLDDPLSAVDAHVGRHLFSLCINGFLKEKSVILVTHQIHFVREADQIVVMNNGKTIGKGTHKELTSSGNFFNIFAEHNEEHDVKKDDTNNENKKDPTLQDSDDDESIEIEAEKLEGEEQLLGRMKLSVFWKYIKHGGSSTFLIFVGIIMLVGQISASLADYFVTFWTNEVSLSGVINSTLHSKSSGLTVHHYEIDLDAKIGPLNTYEYLYCYAGIIAACIIFIMARSFLFFQACMNASKGLHDHMFNKILQGVMHFFDTNPSGRILNRFSKDIGAVDELLPKSYLDSIQIGMVMFSILILVSITNPYMLIPITILLILLYNIFVLYLKTAQDIKRLEGITKSPVFSHVAASLNGIATIRSSAAGERLSLDFDSLQDVHTSSWEEYLACSCTLGFWIDILCVAFLSIVTFSSIGFESGESLSGNVGLAISQSLILTGMLQHGVRQTAEIVSQMTSVERILQYNKIKHETNRDKGEISTPKEWPLTGAVKFDDVSLKYSAKDPPVLKNLDVYVKSGWKVGIVGRTGAGKSSLISALFRLSIIEGEILIDDLDTSKISLQDLRSRISIIPQEPVLFSASVRYNLDPFNKYDDATLWSSLEAVELKEAIISLDMKVSEGGSNFSLGQRQLVCLARAILRNNKILVLDEATANIDPQTDSFIQKTIREKFESCTVLTIAHRLNTIMDSDRVIVMDAGRIVEYNHPHLLLENPDGHLHSLVMETGAQSAAVLENVARESYIKYKEKEYDDNDGLEKVHL